VPVIDEQGHPIGLISMNDIVRESARGAGGDGSTVRADDIVSTLASVCLPRQPVNN
jgi:hypothetical protein